MTAKTEQNTPAASGSIYQRIPAIMREIDPLPKDRRNEAQKYSFRGIDDVYNLVHPVMAKHGVFMSCTILSDRTEERQSKSGGVLIYRVINARYRFTTEDESFVETDVIGEGMDGGDKSANKAMSVGQKYAILQMFLVPTDDPKDPENDSPEVAPKKTAPAASSKSSPDSFFDEPPAESPFDHLSDFTAAKKNLGDETYYMILGGYHANHANEIPVAERPAVLVQMRDAYLKAAKAAKTAKK